MWEDEETGIVFRDKETAIVVSYIKRLIDEIK